MVNVDIVALLLLRDPSTIDPGDKFAPNCKGAGVFERPGQTMDDL